MDPHLEETMLLEKLKESGLISNLTQQVRQVLHVFVASTEPVSIKDLLYAVKRFDPLVSKFTVIRLMNKLTECGLALAIQPQRHQQATKYSKGYSNVIPIAVNTDTIACIHQNLVCADCGAVISMPIVPEGMIQ